MDDFSDSRRVLIVDDDDDARRLHARLIRSAGFTPIELGDATQLVEHVIQHRAFAVILDVSLPHVNGIDACEQLKSNLKTRNCRVVMLTAHKSFEAARRATEAGGDFFLTKPTTPTQLADCLRR